MVPDPKIPKALLWRRLHSLTGFFLSLYLIEHLLVNSQGALFVGNDGSGFVEAVNAIHRLPYLPIIEIGLLGVPILIHLVWGIKYLQTSKINTIDHGGTAPYLPEYPRNHAYTWQRITSWILLFAVIAHVIHMRFINNPVMARQGTENSYMVRLQADEGLPTVAARLGADLYTEKEIENKKNTLPKNDDPKVEEQEQKEFSDWIAALEKQKLRKGEVIAVSPNFGTAELLFVRETFKMPLMMALYTIFVLAACFHAFNGMWTFMISWGITLTDRSQYLMRGFSTLLMCLVSFLGLAAIFGTYWINLKQ